MDRLAYPSNRGYDAPSECCLPVAVSHGPFIAFLLYLIGRIDPTPCASWYSNEIPRLTAPTFWILPTPSKTSLYHPLPSRFLKVHAAQYLPFKNFLVAGEGLLLSFASFVTVFILSFAL